MYRNLDAYLRSTSISPCPYRKRDGWKKRWRRKFPWNAAPSRPRTRWKAGASWARAN